MEERRARQIMAGLPALQAGNAVAVERQALIERLGNTAASESFSMGRYASRQAGRRPPAHPPTVRRSARASSGRVDDVRDRSVRDLSGGIALRPGALHIEFYGAEDLAAKLFELWQAMANDGHAFAQAV